MARPSDWFTPARFRRLANILSSIDGAAPGLPAADAARRVWRVCGGPLTEISDYLALLIELDLIRLHSGGYFRTRGGNKLAKTLRSGDRTGLALTLIHGGCFHDQARHLLERGTNDAHLRLVVTRKEALVGAPQLVSLLELWSEVEVRPKVAIPSSLAAELEAVWTLLPPEREIPEWQLERKAVGNRAELYTVQLERSRVADKNSVHWVARDADDLGWDVEDRSWEQVRRIEVKGSRDRREMFFLSENEWRRANEYGEDYFIHFWGAVDLNRKPAVEYAALRAEGYPVEIQNPAKAINDRKWSATATRWRVERVVDES
ncbi:MAG TPA: DUF3883 domain-containing protein [Candidatus Binatia bacterium]|nr:DUF3883 domain-containing protein [Candidatus Binatia bacterium]